MPDLVAYTNLLESGTVTVTSETTGYPKENLYDWLPCDWWKALAAGTVYVNVDLGSAQSVDCWAVAAHNLTDNSGTIKLQYSSDNFSADINDFDTVQTPSANETIFRKKTSVSARYWRFEITSTGSPSAIGLLFIGVAMEFNKDIGGNFTPPQFADVSTLLTNITESGNFCGRSEISKGKQFTISQTLVPISWYTANWSSFIGHVKTKTFLFAHDYENYPESVALCWSAQKENPVPTHNGPNFMQFSLKVNGQ